RDILALSEPSCIDAPAKSDHDGRDRPGRCTEEPDHGYRSLLRARRERPRRRAAEKRDELAPSHSMTSSAVESSVGGTVRPSALALFEIDHQFEFGRLLHRQIGRLFAFENAVKVDCCPSVQF